MDNLYSFMYRGLLTDESLDKAGRRRHRAFGAEDLASLSESLSLDMLDQSLLAEAQRMALVYQAVHTFENMVRRFVQKALSEAHQEEWWSHVSERIRARVKTRMDEDARFRWHGTRGGAEITYCDFGDLSSMIVTNWSIFEDVVGNMEWAKQLLSTLEKSRNIVMHGGVLAREDIERIGMNIRDWVRQVG
jgi:hypothetical protein